MDSNKLNKKILDWTIGLGFRMPDGSSPPPDFFAFLTVTPHRRQLWETLVEAIQPREKVEIMRKQIFVANLQERKKHVRKQTDRIDLWYKQNALESEVNEKRKDVIRMETNIMEKASSLLFEIHKLREIENQIKELSEKSVVLKLLSRRENKIVEDLNRHLLKVKALFCSKSNMEGFESAKNELLNTGECKCLHDDTQQCNFLNEIEKLCEPGVTEEELWEEVIRWKRSLLTNFSVFLEKLNSTKKNVLSEKKAKMEMVLNQSVTLLKQRIAEKSLQAIFNSVEGKLLDLEVEKLEERVLEEVGCNEIFDGVVSDGMSLSPEDDQTTLENIKNYLNVIGLKSYQEFLTVKTKKLEEETMERKRKGEMKNTKDGEDSLQRSYKEFETIIEEINSLKAEEKKLEEEITSNQKKLELAFRLRKEEKAKTWDLEDVVEILKLSAEKQTDLLLETPLCAFKTIKTPSEGFESGLNNHNREAEHFFSAVLIPPTNNLQKILTEINRREGNLNHVKTFISEREKLAALQRNIHEKLVTVKYDWQYCEKNHKESDRILNSVSYKGEELLQDMDFVEKILKNWVEQPYRLMVRDIVEGKSLREYEEKYRKAINN